MKKLIRLLLILSVVSLSACGDKEARQYAAKLVPVLDSYQEQLSQKIRAEQESYQELAETFEEARKADITSRLSNERERRSEDLGERLSKAREAPTLAQVFATLQEYAKSDFETTQTVLQEAIDARSKYLDNVENLEIEFQKVKLLKDALLELSKGKGDFANFKAATDFLLETDKGVNKLLCADLKKLLDQLTKDKGAATTPAERKRIDQEIKRTVERMATKECS
jgi:uncharacterized lipoprotein YehR (DUF1307 family)